MLRCYLGGALQEEIAEKDAENNTKISKKRPKRNNGYQRNSRFL